MHFGEMFSPTNALRSTKRLFKGRYLQNALRNFESSDSAAKQVYSPLFFDERVQTLLHRMTNVKLETVFRPKATGKALTPPQYKLMTTEELQSVMEDIEKKAKYLLQIPPLIDVKEIESEILNSDTSLDGFDVDHAKHVFVDTSNGLSNDERIVVVREPNGVLRTASHSERVRVIQAYCPISGREINVPPMFSVENIQNVLSREDYEFVLDRACAQFEPYDKIYHRTIELTYEAINERNHFERLHSTRHFGSLVFYLVTHKKIDNLLLDNIKKDRIEDAYDLIEVYHIIYPECKSAEMSSGKTKHERLRNFIEFDSNEKDILSLTLNAYEKREEEREKIESEIKSVHGI